MNLTKLILGLRFFLVILGAFLMIFLFIESKEIEVTIPSLKNYYLNFYYEDTAAKNSVAAIYLNYRVFDTLFEALMLMVSVMEVIHISWGNKHLIQRSILRKEFYKNNQSEVVLHFVGIIFPFLLMIAFYIIINGHNSPGGGFQGGAILATALIARYLIYPNEYLDLNILEKLEKFLFVIILSVPIFFIFMNDFSGNFIFNQIYLVTMNILIGFKVFFGLGVILYRFIFFERLN